MPLQLPFVSLAINIDFLKITAVGCWKVRHCASHSSYFNYWQWVSMCIPDTLKKKKKAFIICTSFPPTTTEPHRGSSWLGNMCLCRVFSGCLWNGWMNVVSAECWGGRAQRRWEGSWDPGSGAEGRLKMSSPYAGFFELWFLVSSPHQQAFQI